MFKFCKLSIASYVDNLRNLSGICRKSTRFGFDKIKITIMIIIILVIYHTSL